MGLTIAYTLKAACGDSAAAVDLVTRLHAFARTLGFEKVGELFVEAEADLADDDSRWHPGARYVTDPARQRHEVIEGEVGDVPVEAHIIHADDSGLIEVRPIEAYWFAANHPGSEPCILGLARYLAVVERRAEDRRPGALDTGLGEGWHWQHFTKTQYAGMPQYGGPDNFLRAHKAVVALLDEAIRLGIDVDVADDSEYWRHRDDERMLRTLREWNGLIAAVGGMLKDRIADVQSPIFEHPEFEHLEAEGDAALHPHRDEPDEPDAASP